MVKTLHRAGLEVILDVVYNHTAEGNEHGPDDFLEGDRQQRLLPARSREPRAPTWTSRARATRSTSSIRDHGSGDGQPAVLGHRHARRRVPLRPRPGAHPGDRGAAQLVLRDHPAGPRALSGQAHRRAVGRGPRRVPAGRRSPRGGPSGTGLSRLHAQILAWGSGPGSRAGRRACTGSSDLYAA